MIQLSSRKLYTSSAINGYLMNSHEIVNVIILKIQA